LEKFPVNEINLIQKVTINISAFFFWGGGEGPRSRSYGRTAALRLILQPCDEDEEKDDNFVHFSK
jgi:hypothetical protein